MDAHQDELQYEKRERAGLVPFLRGDDGQLLYLLMLGSNSKFGGPRPMISKGKLEKNETPAEAAIREAEEELGFKPRNARGELIPIFSGRQELYSGAYKLTVFGVEIQDRYDFDKWGDETEYTMWMSLAEFREDGRRDHVKFLETLENLINTRDELPSTSIK